MSFYLPPVSLLGELTNTRSQRAAAREITKAHAYRATLEAEAMESRE